ncbi:MAG: ROK family protein [Chloroflexota bacterium]
MEVMGVDVGGSGIKAALVNPETGELVTERLRANSPAFLSTKEVIEAILELRKQLRYDGPMGVGFPAVVVHGKVLTPPTALAFPGWDDYDLAKKLAKAADCPTTVINDADAACLAEMEFGAGKDENGVVMVFTFGTGIGSGIFLDSHLTPNSELGRLYMRDSKKTAEQKFSDRARQAKKLSWQEWGKRLNDYFQYIELLFSPELIIIGGGVSKKHEKFIPFIKTRARVLPAAFRNEAGIVGAAMAAVGADKAEPWPLISP